VMRAMTALKIMMASMMVCSVDGRRFPSTYAEMRGHSMAKRRAVAAGRREEWGVWRVGSATRRRAVKGTPGTVSRR
jgi:hypothetical protein